MMRMIACWLACALCLTACEDGPVSLVAGQPERASPLLLPQEILSQFAPLRAQLARALPLQRRGDGFSPAAPSERAGRSPGEWSSTASQRLEVAFPALAHGATRISAGPVTIEVRATAAQPVRATLSGRTLVYRQTYRSADTLVLAEEHRAEELVLLRDASAPRTFSYDVRVVAGSGRVRHREDALEVLDRAGTAWLRLVRPAAFDAAGSRHEVPFTWGRGKLAVTVPDSIGRYPILLDPGWTTTGSLNYARQYHTATLLSDGKVLVVGQDPADNDAEIYDPVANSWSDTSAMTKDTSRGCAAVRLGDGRVLVAGGVPLAAVPPTAALYDPGAGSWSVAAALVNARKFHAAALLPSGMVLACGGVISGTTEVATAEIYDPTAGNSCSQGTECASGHCVDSICCESACDATCMRCALRTEPPPTSASGTFGRCVFVPSGQTDANAAAPCTAAGHVCDGEGHCDKVAGQTCSSGTECLSGLCADATCCDTACDTPCYACNVSASEGTCTAIPAGTPDPAATAPCTGNNTCDGQGSCKLANGQTCSGDAQCAMQQCKDGVCCDTACDGTCESCALEPTDSTPGFSLLLLALLAARRRTR